MEPDYTQRTGTFGGTGWKPNLPRKYPTPDGRKVPCKIRLVTYKGTSAVLARHYHASVEVGENPVWAGDRWAVFGDDPENLPVKLGERERHNHDFTSEGRALAWVQRILFRDFADCEPEWESMIRAESMPVPRPEPGDPDELVEPPPPMPVYCDACGVDVLEHTPEELRRCHRDLGVLDAEQA